MENADFPPAHLLRLFPKMRQERGRQLYEQRDAQVLDVEHAGADGCVTGIVMPDAKGRRSPYSVQLDLVDGGTHLLVDCSCLTANYCQHGFALLLAYGDMLREAARKAAIPTQTPLRAVDTHGAGHGASEWRQRMLDALDDALEFTESSQDAVSGTTVRHEDVQIYFAVDLERSRAEKRMSLAAMVDGVEDGKRVLKSLSARRRPRPLAASDRQALDLLDRVGTPDGPQSTWLVPPDWLDLALSLVSAQGRLCAAETLRRQGPPIFPLRIDTGAPFTFATALAEDSDDGAATIVVRGELRRGSERHVRAAAVLSGGRAVVADRIVSIRIGPGIGLARTLLEQGPMQAPREQSSELLSEILAVVAQDPAVEAPVALQRVAPSESVLVVHTDKLMGRHVPCDLMFAYGERHVEFDDPSLLDPISPRDPWRARDLEAERRLLEQFERTHRSRIEPSAMKACFLMKQRSLLADLTAIVASGQRVLANGKPIVSSTSCRVSVKTGIDWFDVRGEVQFDGGGSIPLAKALLAARRNERLVELGDGRTGVLPEQLLERWAKVLDLGEADGESVRMRRSQALLLDALLAAQSAESDVDDGFRSFRQRLQSFTGITARAEPQGFEGTLRSYQREGLGWLMFLRELGIGGCLADDMGLGKTVQVLAMLLEVHRRGDGPPSLLVVPRSLLDNWRAEAKRFTPTLRVLDFSGPGRWTEDPGRFEGLDVVLTTYGTLRSDIARFVERETTFEHAILDEAQAVENAQSVTSKAVRLLRARHRLALTGTPVQNHIGELWALFEFLSPGLLGSSKTFQQLVGGTKGRMSTEDLALLRKALAPFLLRRTKEQVLQELPPKQEQTITCDLEGSQRRAYDSLRQHYREVLLHGSGTLDNKERFAVLEALLRLRQAACHEGLIDPARAELPSAKLDALVPMLSEITESGHKALVFSQFTSFLGIVKKRLDALGIDYEYLDGRTRKRQPKVDRFQQDPACSVFLISLKAGGFGLNLTAADYVFLLDPWWNPAAEAQAVDRAHRIGQTQRVVAYRLVARDTVEDKVLQLQQEKRSLADALLGDNASLLAGLDREQLAALLS